MDYLKSLLLLKIIWSLLSSEMLIISLMIAKGLLWWCVFLMIMLKTATIPCSPGLARGKHRQLCEDGLLCACTSWRPWGKMMTLLLHF